MRNGRLQSVAAFGIVSALFLSGCLSELREYHEFAIDEEYVNPGVIPGAYTPGEVSKVLRPGVLERSKPVVVHLKSEHPAYHSALGGPASAENDVQISFAYWLPKNFTGKLPVIIDAGPYFETGTHCVPDQHNCIKMENNTIDYPGQTSAHAIDNFLPLGYAVAQIAIRGTGTSGGCMELFGPREVSDLHQAITWLATQPWSNGNVALQGVSYDGSTPWMAAARKNPHVKTIVPISGLPDIYDLMFHNGSAESRGRVMQQFVYWPYGFSPDYPGNIVAQGGVANNRSEAQNRQNLLCPEAWEGAAMGPYTATTGGRGEQFSKYWEERDFRDDILKNYTGSVFLIHGLQDWNVDPHSAIPFNAELKAKGIRVKEMYGQWGHTTPDGTCAARAPHWAWTSCRFDYAEILYRWYEHELKGNTTLWHGPMTQIQDNRGFWRMSDSYPPTDATWTKFYPSGKELALKPTGATTATLFPPSSPSSGPAHYLEFKTDPFPVDTRIAGLPQFHIEFEALGPGGYLGAWLFDENATGHVLERKVFNPEDPFAKPILQSRQGMPQVIGHAQMDLRYYEGGDKLSPPKVGGRPVAKMEFDPLDVLIPAGHRLTVWLFQYHYTYDHVASATPSPVRVYLGSPNTYLRAPIVDVDAADIYPVPGSNMPRQENFEYFHVEKPKFSQTIPPPAAFGLADDCVAATAWQWNLPAGAIPIAGTCK